MTGKEALDETRLRTVVLVGGQDFGRCRLAARLPAALWPVAGRPALERLLNHLAAEGIREATVCCADAVTKGVGFVEADPRLTTRLAVEELSSGTAGCLRDAVASDPGDAILVLSGSMVCPPSIRDLVEAHAAGGADLTVAFNPGRSIQSQRGTSAEIYVCRPDVLRLIPAGGYCDIKEGLIPSILRAGGSIRPLVLPRDVGNYHDHWGYLRAMALYLESDVVPAEAHALCERSHRRVSAAGTGAHVDSDAQIYGPVAVAEGTHIAGGAVLVGPAVVDRGAQIGKNSIVVESVLWDGCSVGAGCEVRGAVIERGAVVPDGSVVVDRTVSARRTAATRAPAAGADAAPIRERRAGQPVGVGTTALAWSSSSRRQLAWGAAGAALLAAFLWSYWPILVDLSKVWQRSDEYSAGLLVPFLAAYVLWSRRRDLAGVPVRPAVLWGTAIFVLAQAMRLFGLLLMYSSAERLSIVLGVTALVILLFGWRVLREVAGVLLFLFLMLPWPHRIQARIGLPLQGWATDSAVFCLELIGYEVARDGNVIGIGRTNVAVAEACNGLRMVTAFLVISALVVLLVKRTWWEKLIILASSLPIALLCNTLRLAVTAVAFTILEGDNVEKLFHDFGGYAMMPLALALVVGEFWLLGRLVSPENQVTPAVITRRRPQHAVDS